MADPLVAARAALSAFSRYSERTIRTVIAIAGAESSFDPRAKGGAPSQVSRPWRAVCEKDHCGGYCAVGLWQIFFPVHRERIARLSGGVLSTDAPPCEVAAWLENPYHNARVAESILKEQGLDAWQAYRSGAYRRHLATAGRALDVALRESGAQLASLAEEGTLAADVGTWVRGIGPYAATVALLVGAAWWLGRKGTSGGKPWGLPAELVAFGD